MGRKPDVITAVATAPGRGGVGIVRLSGPDLSTQATILGNGKPPPPRHAIFSAFHDSDGRLIDEGLLLYFPAPHSFTGEDVIEMQGHGGPVVMQLLLERALSLAAHGGFYRIFLDEGATMRDLLARARGIMPEYIGRLLATPPVQPLIDPLSPRELDVLRLIADGLSNQAIGERLFLALSTVKGYVANIFGKLQVKRRTEAVARARELGLL